MLRAVRNTARVVPGVATAAPVMAYLAGATTGAGLCFTVLMVPAQMLFAIRDIARQAADPHAPEAAETIPEPIPVADSMLPAWGAFTLLAIRALPAVATMIGGHDWQEHLAVELRSTLGKADRRQRRAFIREYGADKYYEVHDPQTATIRSEAARRRLEDLSSCIPPQSAP